MSDILHDLPKTCIVVPCHNEAGRLQSNEIVEYLRENAWLYICFVDDGSTDDTTRILTSISDKCPERVSIIRLGENIGKAEAVRAGILNCMKIRPDLVGYMDADMATPLHGIEQFLEFAQKFDNAVVFTGCRLKRLGAIIERKLWRHYPGRIFATAASLVLDLPVYDTQCGAKFFRLDIASKIFSERFLSRWFFDVEIFARVTKIIGKDNALKQIVEVPLLEWRDKEGSKLRIRQYFIAIIDLLRILFSYRKR